MGMSTVPRMVRGQGGPLNLFHGEYTQRLCRLAPFFLYLLLLRVLHVFHGLIVSQVKVDTMMELKKKEKDSAYEAQAEAKAKRDAAEAARAAEKVWPLPHPHPYSLRKYLGRGSHFWTLYGGHFTDTRDTGGRGVTRR